MRPVLPPAVRRLWRDPETLQLGRVADRAVVLAGLDPAVRTVLTLLDGTRDLGEVLQAATAAGCTQQRTQDLLALLQGAGLLEDAVDRWPDRLEVSERDRLAADVASLGMLHAGRGLSVLRRRDAVAVVVVGGGRVGAPLAALLATTGVGAVDVVDDGAARPQDAAVGGLVAGDSGRRRGEAARQLIRTETPSTRTGPVPRPDLVVLAPTGALDDVQVAALLRDGVPHLLAEVRDTVGIVGPLVLPGRTACLRCLDLSRTDRDPEWPVLSAQLSAVPRASPPCDSALAAAVVAQAALQVLALLDGGAPATLGGTLELPLPDWRWRRRSWPAHADCDCRWQATG